MGDTLRKSGCQRNTCCNAPLSPQHVSAQRPPRMPLLLLKWLKKNLYAFCFPDQLETLWAILAFIEQPKQICASKTAFTHICHFLLGSFSPWLISSAGFLQVDMQLDLEWKYTRQLCVLQCHKIVFSWTVTWSPQLSGKKEKDRTTIHADDADDKERMRRRSRK